MNKLTDIDLHFVVQRLPRDVRVLLSQHPRSLYVGGGFIRDMIGDETPNDIDLFGPSADYLDRVATILAAGRPDAKVHRSKYSNYAITLITPNQLPIQFNPRCFDNPESLVESFDSTICQAVIWRDGNRPYTSPWRSLIGADFYHDLAKRQIVYTSPRRSPAPTTLRRM